MLRLLFAGAMLLVSIASASAADDAAAPATSKPAAPNMQEPAVGDHWTYQVTDEISGNVTATRTVLVTELSKTEVTTRFDIAGTGRSGVIVYDRSWNLLTEGALRHSPNDGSGIRSPLAPNAQWKFTADTQNSTTGATFKRVGSARVTGKETITTKAGTFEAFVIETKYTTRNTKNPSRFSEISLKTWFSPDLDHWVKRSTIVRDNGHLVRSDMAELTDFGRKNTND